MIKKTKAIVLRNTNYSESSVISRMYTREYGIRSYLLQSVRKGKSAIKSSMIIPLSLIEMEVYHKPNVDLGRVKELVNSPVLHNILADIRKKSIAMFYIEILNQCLTEELCEEELFDFIQEHILLLEEATSDLALLPHHFLLGLTLHLGVQPLGQYSASTPFLSMSEGAFVPLEGTDCFSEDESLIVSNILHRENYKCSSSIRKSLLRNIIKYYQHHIIKNRNIQSIDVLSELLA